MDEPATASTPATGGSGAPTSRALPDNLFGWVFVLGLGALLFFVGYAVGRETAPEGARAAASPSSSPTTAPTGTLTPQASPAIDFDALDGQWLFELSETSDTCGRFPASYSENLTITTTNDTIRVPESFPPGTEEAGEEALEASGNVSRSGAFSAEAETGGDAASARQIRYSGAFTAADTARGAYEIQRDDCRASYSLQARKLS